MWCYLTAAVLIASGIVHNVIWMWDGSSLAGDTSWRKPMLFGYSAGVTVWSVGWLAQKLRPRRGDAVLLTLFAVAMLAEVGLITLQTWRSVPSHFNRSTPIDTTILVGIEGLIALAALFIFDLGFRCCGPLNASRDMALAIRGGMALLVFACLFGFFMVVHGNRQIAAGNAPGIYGAHGVMKFPHGIPIHAIQYLPLLAWMLSRMNVPEPVRIRSVAWATAGIVSFTLFSLLQTFGGRARFDTTPGTRIVLWLSVAMLVAAFSAIFHHIRPSKFAS